VVRVPAREIIHGEPQGGKKSTIPVSRSNISQIDHAGHGFLFHDLFAAQEVNDLDARAVQGHGANAWMTVPAFGDWDMKNGAMPDYSMDFSKIREMRKQNKKELSRASLGGDDDILAHHQQHQHQQQKPAKAPTKLGGTANDHRRQPLHGRDDSPTVCAPCLL
jgi:hypothetical protein